MKFLLDAHLPPGLRQIFADAGHDAIHTLDLPERNLSKDGALNTVSLAEQRVVVTKDTDFYYSHLLHGPPWKLVLVRTGNMGLGATKALFARYLPEGGGLIASRWKKCPRRSLGGYGVAGAFPARNAQRNPASFRFFQ